jgi:hypothetical protein
MKFLVDECLSERCGAAKLGFDGFLQLVWAYFRLSRPMCYNGIGGGHASGD